MIDAPLLASELVEDNSCSSACKRGLALEESAGWGPRIRALRSAQDIGRALSSSRRDFLRAVTGATSAATLFGVAPRRAIAAPRREKAVVVTFGGGARDQETFMPEGQEN